MRENACHSGARAYSAGLLRRSGFGCEGWIVAYGYEGWKNTKIMERQDTRIFRQIVVLSAPVCLRRSPCGELIGKESQGRRTLERYRLVRVPWADTKALPVQVGGATWLHHPAVSNTRHVRCDSVLTSVCETLYFSECWKSLTCILVPTEHLRQTF